MNFSRCSGLLVHITALPSKFGIGDLGPDAFKFVDWLKDSGQSLWQMLPIGIAYKEGCPYAALSAFGGYSLLISPEKLVEDGLLTVTDIKVAKKDFSTEQVDFEKVEEKKLELFQKAFEKFKKDGRLKEKYEEFLNDSSYWVHDLAEFQALSNKHGLHWPAWPNDLKRRSQEALDLFNQENTDLIYYYKFLQFIFFRQWFALKNYANHQGIKLIGDIPIFVGHHSMDVWKTPSHFRLGLDGEMFVETGAAPDAFSAVGQKWETPNYDWPEMQKDDFGWWHLRMKFMLDCFDIVRVDHFRGFCAIWEVHSGAPNAINGWWYWVPGRDLFNSLVSKLGKLPIIAEDLGKITDDVYHLRDEFEFPGMLILQEAFGDQNMYNMHLPHNYKENSAVYTGTHDHTTIMGYINDIADHDSKEFMKRYLQIPTLHNINWDLIRLAMISAAKVAVIPIQDVIGLGSEARFNLPGTEKGNWMWRFQWSQLEKEDQEALCEIAIESQRNGLGDEDNI